MSNGKEYNRKSKDTINLENSRVRLVPVQTVYLIQEVTERELDKLTTLCSDFNWYLDEFNSEELGSRVIAIEGLENYKTILKILGRIKSEIQ